MSTILNPLLGGIVIGLATTMLLAFNGKIMGVSGILRRVVLGQFTNENIWRYAFLFGLLLGAVIMLNFFSHYFHYQLDFSYLEAVIAGLLVGFSTQMANGCTSGHGVCGLPRFSIRSIAATLIFMFAGIITVLIRGLA